MKPKILINVLLLTTLVAAQNTTELISGSKNNLFELSLANTTNKTMQSVTISVEEKPDWITFDNNEILFENIPQSGKQTAQFYFNVSETSPIAEEGNIAFRITDQSGKSHLKNYKVIVSVPKRFEVEQNYPNPFNPSTTIKYSIPQVAFVSINVFNVLGEKVAELVNKDIIAGIHEVVFNANSISSGFYFYVVSAKGLDGTKYFASKKMMLVK